ncbi:MAG: T9SS type A sorting domain-containing protein [Bacteroidota bacterium]
MKKLYIFSTVALAVAVSAGAFFFKSDSGETLSEHEMENKPRAEWELMRLRDPATGKIPEGIRFKELEFAKTLPVRESFLKGKDGILASGDWKPRGPYNVGGRTRALAVDVTNDNILLAGGVSGGMWRSTDGGASWKKTTAPEQLQSVSSITQDTRPGKTNVWYYGTGELTGNSAGGDGAYFHGNGVFKSIDGGMSWQPIATTATNTPATFDSNFDNMWNIVTDPSNLAQDELYAAIYGGVYRSIDGGAKWTQVLGGSPTSYYTDVAVTPTGMVYAALSSEGGKKGLWRSADGIIWNNITPANYPKTFKRTVIAIAPSDENQVYFLNETPGAGFEGLQDGGHEIRHEWHSLWKYTYVGGNVGTPTWEDRSLNLPAFGLPAGNFVSQGSYDLEIAVKPDNADHVFIGGTNTYRSTDGFKTATQTAWIGGYDKPTPATKFPQYPNHHSDQHAFVFLKNNPNVLINGNDGGIQKTMNNLAERVEWIPLNNGYVTTQFYSVAIDHATPGNNVIVGGLQDNGSWFTNNNVFKTAWTKPHGADGAFSAIADGRSAYYLSTQNGKVSRFIMNDNGDTLQRRRIDPVGGKGYLFINPFVLDTRDNNKMYIAGGQIIWRNNNLAGIPLDGGKDSTNVNWDSLPNTRIDTANKISALASAKTADRLYYGTSDGKVLKVDNISVGNPTAVNITGSNFPKGAYVNCIAVDPRDADKAIVVFSNYAVVSLFSTSDGGATWTPVAGNLEQNAIGNGSGPSTRWLTILPVGNGTMYLVGTSTGIYSTAFLDGNSTTWVQEGASTIGNVVVDMLDSRVSDGLVVAGTHGNGVYSANITSLPAVAAIPTLIAPEQNKKAVLQTVKLEWNAIPGSLYTLEVVDALGAVITTASGISNNFYTLNNLEQGVKDYFWHVRATNEGGQSAYSETRKFTTAVAAPVLKTPADQEITIRNPLLNWERSNGATSYHVQVSKNLGFTNLVIDTKTSTEELQISELDANTKYYWRVSAANADGDGLYSVRRSFTTNGATSVREADNSTVEFLQSYPNPFKNSSTIRFKTSKPGTILLAVYDISGRKVAVLKDGFADAGENSVSFKSDNLPNGKYFISLSGNGLLKTIPVEIVR